MALAKPSCQVQQGATKSTHLALQLPAGYQASGPDQSGIPLGSFSESSLDILGMYANLFPPLCPPPPPHVPRTPVPYRMPAVPQPLYLLCLSLQALLLVAIQKFALPRAPPMCPSCVPLPCAPPGCPSRVPLPCAPAAPPIHTCYVLHVLLHVHLPYALSCAVPMCCSQRPLPYSPRCPVDGCDQWLWIPAMSGSPRAQPTEPSRSGTWPLAS